MRGACWRILSWYRYFTFLQTSGCQPTPFVSFRGLLKVDVRLSVIFDVLVGLEAPQWVLRDLLKFKAVHQEVYACIGPSDRQPRMRELCGKQGSNRFPRLRRFSDGGDVR